jgi:hypothetical protein
MDALDLKYMFNEMDGVDEHPEYENYLTQHISNVKKGYEWLKNNLPEVVSVDNYFEETAYYGELDEIIAKHDQSKYTKLPDANEYYDLKCEYFQYANYFYGEKTPKVKKNFNYAWLSHIHCNPHHWQHWMLQNDEDGLILLDMPYVFTLEMFCDWWAFSWKQNNLYEVFNWYEKNKKGILLSDKSRRNIEMILSKVKEKLDAGNK